ncbi:MAG: hypothetical protein AAFV95_01740 [Bacteroidota bacterium]
MTEAEELTDVSSEREEVYYRDVRFWLIIVSVMLLGLMNYLNYPI